MSFLGEVRPLDREMETTTDALYIQIVGRIRQLILEGKLKEGDRLPSERELGQMLQVSRVPVREALKTLEFLGAVRHIRGKGVFVKKIQIGSVVENIDFVLVDPIHALEDLFEAREAIEYQAAFLAARRRTAQDLAVLEGIIIEMEKLLTLGHDIAEASLKFHTAVVAASHNVVLARINEFLADLLLYSRRETLRDVARRGSAVKHHRQILARIEQRDAEGAAAAMRDHLAEAKRVIRRNSRREKAE